jgi:Flp pilus assembly protein TadD
MTARLLAALCFTAAHGFLYFGRPGNRLAVWMLALTLRFNPRHHRARAWLGYLDALSSMSHGDPEQAVKLLRAAINEAPGETPIRTNLGIALTMLGRHQEAIHVLRGVLKENADARQDVQVWRALAWCLLRTGQLDGAVDVLSEANDFGLRAPDFAVLSELCTLARGGAKGQRGQPAVTSDDAGRLGALIRSRPRMLPLTLEFAEHEAAAGRLAVTRKVVSRLPETLRADSLRIMAESRLNADDPDTAATLVGLLSELVPGSLGAGLLRSELALRRGQYPDAVREGLAAAEADPSNPRALHQLGLSLLHVGEVEDAARQFALAMAAGSASALAGGVVALQLLAQGKTADARKVFVHERSGDALGCAYAHTAQALLFAEEGNWREFERLATWSDQEFADIPAALRAATVTAPLLAARETMQARRDEKAKSA